MFVFLHGHANLSSWKDKVISFCWVRKFAIRCFSFFVYSDWSASSFLFTQLHTFQICCREYIQQSCSPWRVIIEFLVESNKRKCSLKLFLPFLKEIDGLWDFSNRSILRSVKQLSHDTSLPQPSSGGSLRNYLQRNIHKAGNRGLKDLSLTSIVCEKLLHYQESVPNIPR